MKQKYHLKNWREYNESLKQRGSIKIWISEDALAGWCATKNNRRGRPRLYADSAIQLITMLGLIYHQRLRQLEGLTLSLFSLLTCTLPVPDYTTLSRRMATLQIERQFLAKDKIHLIVDSTGLKVFGEGEWKVRQHGYSKRRTWRKIHIGQDTDGEIRVALLTDNACHDSAAVPRLFQQESQPILSLRGDGAYDTNTIYNLCGEQTMVIVPPRRNAKITANTPSQRQAAILRIRQTSRPQWKKESGYHVRSRVESTMFRRKIIFGDKLHARRFERQTTEALLTCVGLNRMWYLGRPISYPVVA